MFKTIHIGSLLKMRMKELNIEMSRACKFFKCTEPEIEAAYQSSSLDSETLLKWSKLLEYDYFRLYSQHLILYAPQGNSFLNKKNTQLPQFRKSIYTIELIYFIIDMVNTGEKTKKQITDEYKIPKATLHKWLVKYSVANINYKINKGATNSDMSINQFKELNDQKMKNNTDKNEKTAAGLSSDI